MLSFDKLDIDFGGAIPGQTSAEQPATIEPAIDNTLSSTNQPSSQNRYDDIYELLTYETEDFAALDPEFNEAAFKYDLVYKFNFNTKRSGRTGEDLARIEQAFHDLKSKLTTVALGKFISFISVWMVLFSSLTYAVFWTLVSRLLTDPNYIKIQQGYENNSKPSCECEKQDILTTDNTSIALVSILILLIELFRNYLTVVGIPLGVNLFAGFMSAVRSSSKTLYYRRWCVIVCGISVILSLIVSVISLFVLFGVDIYIYSNGNGMTNRADKLINGAGGCVACFIQVALWIICFCCFKTFESKPKNK